MYRHATPISDRIGQNPERKAQRKQKPLGVLPKGLPHFSLKSIARAALEQAGGGAVAVALAERQERIDAAIAKMPHVALQLHLYQRLADKFAALNNFEKPITTVPEKARWFQRLLNKFKDTSGTITQNSRDPRNINAPASTALKGS